MHIDSPRTSRCRTRYPMPSRCSLVPGPPTGPSLAECAAAADSSARHSPDLKEGRRRSRWRSRLAPTGPLVSIVTPTLNQAEFIADTLRSVRDQTYDNVEHIVVDGGSVDGTLELLETYRSSYNLRWISEPDGGMYEAVNRGLRMARGKIVAYLNSDDVLFPWAVSVAVAVLEKGPQIDLVYGDAVNFDDRTGAEHLRIQPSFEVARRVSAWSVPQPAAFWRSRVHELLGYFDESLQCAGDVEFFARVGAHLQVTKVDEVLAMERLHDETKSVRLVATSRLEKARIRAMYPGQGAAPVRLGKARAIMARRAAWLRYIGTKAGLAGNETSWARFRGECRPKLSPGRLALGLIPGVPLAWKEGSVTLSGNWMSSARDRQSQSN